VLAISYKSLVWLIYHLLATFTFGIPLVLMFWSSFKNESTIYRHLSIYFKVSGLLAVSILLLIGNQTIGYLTSFLSAILIVSSLWFWVDLNEEINEMPLSRPIALTFRAWRWGLTMLGISYGVILSKSLYCLKISNLQSCSILREGPLNLHELTGVIFRFLFGGEWTHALAGFIGYLTLFIYFIGFTQWLIIKLPRQGRIAGGF